jgi:hypothetical protein
MAKLKGEYHKKSSQSHPVYHNSPNCELGGEIRMKYLRIGQGKALTRRLCPECEERAEVRRRREKHRH